ncbi:hypothetical protein HPB51_006150 [Rhipicephalus microplus]|uniref:Uncharacterized protein n=1 Tax=Rhipicephalus microplus TaxID=6941 RepID=A0A9J6ER55_RHIMP|nr:hypothetical protein HPB51_006150 [Rhipicephalus microplus]
MRGTMAVASAALSSFLFSTNDDGAWEEVILFSCTRDQTRVCHLLNHLTAFNDVLWNVGLQLRQVDEKKQLGNLVLATVPGICDDFPLCSWCAVNEEQPVSFLNCLLRVHRCIVSAEMNIGVANSAMVIRALASSSSLRRLTVRGTELRDEQDPRIITLSQVPVGGLVSGYVYPGNIWAAPVVPCLLQQDSNATLTSLDVVDLEMTPPGVSMLITTLMNNRTVTELAVGYNVFARSPERPCSVPFEQYLTQRNVPLRKLALKSFRPFGDTSRLCFLAQAISSMTMLEELYARWPSRQIPCEIFAKMVLQSKSLQSVSLLLQNVDNAIVDLTHLKASGPDLGLGVALCCKTTYYLTWTSTCPGAAPTTAFALSKLSHKTLLAI